jgi:hypothetical protein
MKKKTLLVLAIIMALLTTFLIYAGFAFIPPSRDAMILICVLSFCGYSASYIYYLTFKEQKS